MDRRDQLLHTAERLARERGIDGFSYADIAADVGIRKPSIHHHFPHKADLALALIERYAASVRQALDSIDSRAENAGDRLHAFLDVYRAALNGGRSLCLCVAFSAGRESLSDPVLLVLNAFHEHVLSWLEGTFKQGAADETIRRAGDPEAESATALALVEGGQLLARAAGRLDPFDSAVRSLRERIVE